MADTAAEPYGLRQFAYQSFSAFAGNPYLIDLDLLAEDGLLDRAAYKGAEWGNNPESVDYGILYEKRTAVLHRHLRVSSRMRSLRLSAPRTSIGSRIMRSSRR